MRRALPLLLLLLLAPASQACSLAYQPFLQATWESGDLRFVGGDSLVEVRGATESVLAKGFFLSFAAADGGLLAAGQEGLGADCSGTDWLRWSSGGAVAWERSGLDRGAHVLAHADGPFVALGGKWWRWSGGDLHGTAWALPGDSYVQGVSADGGPVYRAGEQVVVGRHEVPVSTSEAFAVAHNTDSTALVTSGTAEATLRVLSKDGTVRETRWAAQQGQVGAAWAETAGWVVAAGGRAFLVSGDTVTDLGVEAVAVAARGPQPVAFQESGYTVFSGTLAVERWTRSPDGAWSAGAPGATPRPVSASFAGGSASSAPPPPDEPKGIPGPAFAWALALAVLAAWRRRPPPFEG